MVLEGPSITTARLLMRRWLPSDREPFVSICSDPEVMRFFPARLSEAETLASIERMECHFDENGFGLWALERRVDGRFIGFTGLSTVRVDCAIAGEIEVGWRLGKQFWGQGFAREAATAALDLAFRVHRLPRVVSITTVVNERSQGLMQRLGMKRVPELDFDHPRMGKRRDLTRHIVYSIGGTDMPAPVERTAACTDEPPESQPVPGR